MRSIFMRTSLEGLSIPGWHDEVLDGYIFVNGIRIRKVEIGQRDQSLVILLHGFNDFWWGWREQMGPLASAGYNIISPDQRGYNLSEKPPGIRAYDPDILSSDIIELAKASGHERFHLIGHDLGGQIAWWLASRYPEHVQTLTTINSMHPQALWAYIKRHPRQWLRNWYIEFFRLPRLPEAMLSRHNYSLVRDGIRAVSRQDTFSDEIYRIYKEAWARPGTMKGMINWYRALRRKPQTSDWRITVPNLMLWGNRNQYLDQDLARASLAHCADGKVVWFENGTHYLHLEEVKAVNDTILAFLKNPDSFPSEQTV
jgi:pimeloyl-ACP methyl ester carboxylesterase